MTAITINVADEVVEAFDRAFPGQSIEAIIERLLRDEVARREARSRPDAETVLEKFRSIREAGAPLSNDEIRRLRHEGRK